LRRPDPAPTTARWITIDAPEDETRALAASLSVPPLVARLLWIRGHRSQASAGIFLRPRLQDLLPPSVLPDMDVAARRIAAAVRARERIAVCGDYDVDGMTGTALLVRFLRLAGGDVTYAIPDREAEGYGLSVAGVERLAAAGVRLAITVDNGISAHEAVARANALGIDVVVTDHHLPGGTLPPAQAVVDPQRTDRPGSMPSLLCGCGLAFKLAWGVAEAIHGSRKGGATRDESLSLFLRDAVGYAALATVSDVMPLVGENRILVTHGLAALRGSPHAGVRALLESAGLSGAALTADDVAWKIAPRLNAAGRMNRPDVAIELLTTDDPARARALAAAMEAMNDQRRTIEKGVLAEAAAQAERRLSDAHLAADRAGRRSLVVSGDGWHRGVIGIVAARLVDAHRRPTVVIGLEGEGGRGSCRTPGDVNLHEALSRCAAHLRRFGGHAAAAGLEVARDAIPAFEAAFEAAVREQVDGRSDEPTLELDGEVPAGEFTLETVEHVRRLAPFGEENPEPRFLVRGATVAGRARLMGGSSDHLSFAVKTASGGAIRVVAFRRADLFDLASSGAPLDLAVTPTVNEWRGLRSPELLLVDARPSA
jgi:single-stranded-DNA-specific exonuclease